MQETTISWTDRSWNPLRGCSKCSPGCQNCYAASFAERFRGVVGNAFEYGFDLRLAPHKLTEPAKLKKPQLIFVNSTSDLFHPDVPLDFIRQVCLVMLQTDRHIFQVLTKRAERMREVLGMPEFHLAARAEHIFWGVTCEDRNYGVPRIRQLQMTSVRNRFVSAEPLLEDLGDLDLRNITWMICGGESGKDARPFNIAWAENLQHQCLAEGVAFFMKQLGARPRRKGEAITIRKAESGRRDSHAGDWAMWPASLAHLQVREFPAIIADFKDCQQ